MLYIRTDQLLEALTFANVFFFLFFLKGDVSMFFVERVSEDHHRQFLGEAILAK